MSPTMKGHSTAFVIAADCLPDALVGLDCSGRIEFVMQEGIDYGQKRTFVARNGPVRLRDDTLHFGGQLTPASTGAKLLSTRAQYSYWLLAERAGVDVKRGDLTALKGLPSFSSMLACEYLGAWQRPRLGWTASSFACPRRSVSEAEMDHLRNVPSTVLAGFLGDMPGAPRSKGEP